MNQNEYISRLQEEITPLRQAIINHRVYGQLTTLTHLQQFMQHHIFAVWDFMSLLKTLQQELTCVNVPWVPKGSATTRYLINEIVTGEESDVDQQGRRTSHFELYLEAMKQAGADDSVIRSLLHTIGQGVSINQAIKLIGADNAVISFMANTFETIASGKAYLQAAVFTFGREDLIPGMFISFVRELDARHSGKVAFFKYYLERHIEVDGDHHSHLAYEMTSELCGTDEAKWEEATIAVKKALKARIHLWDAIAAAVK